MMEVCINMVSMELFVLLHETIPISCRPWEVNGVYRMTIESVRPWKKSCQVQRWYREWKPKWLSL